MNKSDIQIPIPMGWENPVQFLRLLSERSEQYWTRKGETHVLSLFHQMAVRVPAYKDFLKKQRIDHEKIKTIHDFSLLPTTNKYSYLKAYPRKMLSWDGKFASKQWTIATTSGSTGEPFYFPRETYQDLQYALTAELYLRTNFNIHKKSTLYIIGFPMGAWIGGVFTYQAIRLVAERGDYPLSIITPGINKIEIIKAVRNLGPNFDQIIIGSYAPFLKDIIDDGVRYGVNWKEYNLNFIFSAECVSEAFKDYLVKKTGITNVFKQTLNHYGTVDLGTMSHETPLTIMLRRMAVGDSKIHTLLFSDVTKQPTLTQYNPVHFFFEDVSGNLLCSSFSGLPLIRYDLKDHGGVLSFDTTRQKLQEYGVTILKEARTIGIADTIWNLPFVYVYERSDFSVSFFAFQIYPETIRKALQDREVEDYITGKFTMQVYFNKKGEQIFEINVELKAKKRKTKRLYDTIVKFVIERLIENNSEYRKTHEVYPDKTIPKVVFWPYEHPKYFKPGIKQKWVKRE